MEADKSSKPLGVGSSEELGILLDRLDAATEDYTLECGTGDLYELAAKMLRALHAQITAPPKPVTLHCPTCKTAATFRYLGAVGGE
jgi:hypothetical protein